MNLTSRSVLVVVVVGLCGLVTPLVVEVRALENGLARTPPMGWLSWERFTCELDCQAYPDDCISSKLYRDMAKVLVSEGYSKLGYTYVNIDDCWSELGRDESTSELLANSSRFPEGIDGLAAHLHSMNLKLGIYGDCGTATCAGYPAQLKSEANLEDNYFELDARRLADWQVDSFKFDGCNLDPARAEGVCPLMTRALNATDRPMVVVCEWPFYMLREKYQLRRALEPNFSLAAESCNAWRYYEDVEDSWLSVLSIVDFTIRLQQTIYKHHGPGHWFDPDQLIVGNFALSLDQARAQMALWCIWSAPLYMSNDLRHMDKQMAAVLKNELLIGVDQDPMGVFGLMVAESNSSRYQAFVKPTLPIRNGCPSFVVVYLNRDTLGNSNYISFKTRDLLTRVPISLAAQRAAELSPGEAAPFDGESCKRKLQVGMTRDPNDAKLLNKPMDKDGDTSAASWFEITRYAFQVIDLYNDEVSLKQTTLNGELTLRVNPSGVRAVKLIML